MQTDIPSVVAAKQQISAVIGILRANDGGYADMLQELLDGMDDWYSTKENLFKVGEICQAKALGDQQIGNQSALEWMAEVESLRRYCARAFNELERQR